MRRSDLPGEISSARCQRSLVCSSSTNDDSTRAHRVCVRVSSNREENMNLDSSFSLALVLSAFYLEIGLKLVCSKKSIHEKSNYFMQTINKSHT